MHRVGAAFGVPASTFLRWIAEMDWPRRSARGASAPAASAASPAGGRARKAPEKLRMPARIGNILGQEAPETLVAFFQACVVARMELDRISAYPPQSLSERERVARVIASLSTTLMRLQRGYEREQDRFVTPIARKRLGLKP